VTLSSDPSVQATYAVTANLTVLGAFNLSDATQQKVVSIYPVLNSTSIPSQSQSTCGCTQLWIAADVGRCRVDRQCVALSRA